MPPSPLRVHSALITVSLLFGGNYVLAKRILAEVPAPAWVVFRIAAASCVLVPLALWLRQRRTGSDLRLWLGLVVASFFGVALNQVLFTEGLARTTPEHSAVVNTSIPAWTVVVAVLARQERLTLRLVAAVLSALAGVLYLLGVDRLALGAPVDQGGATLLGDVLSMANALVFAVHLVVMRRLAPRVDPWVATAAMFVLGTAMLLPWSLPHVGEGAATALSTQPILTFALYVVLGGTVLTYLLNTWALRHTHSSQVALYINVQPLVAALLNAAMGAGLPGHRFFVALALVAAGLWLQTRARR